MGSHWEDSLRSHGHRLTPQRRAVLRVLCDAGGHCTLAEIQERLRNRFPEIPLPTVYRNLRCLVDAGLAAQTDLGSGAHVYEFVADKHHHHLVCLRCQHVIDLPDAFLDPLRETLKQQFHFVPCMEHFALFGICPSCSGEPRPAEKGTA